MVVVLDMDSTLAQGDIVVMDNLGSHKGKAIRRAIRVELQ
jgi:hypothetical protein